MNTQRNGAVGRPTAPLLNSSRIARAALTYLKRYGKVSIPGIAKALGVHPSSLYYHVPDGKLGIIRLARQELYAAIPLGELRDRDRPWGDRLENWMHAYRNANTHAPVIVPLLVSERVDDPRTLEIYEALFEILTDAGIEPQMQMAISAAVDAACMGSTIDTLSPAPLFAGGAGYPRLTAVTSYDTGSRSEKGWQLAVKAIIHLVTALGAQSSVE